MTPLTDRDLRNNYALLPTARYLAVSAVCEAGLSNVIVPGFNLREAVKYARRLMGSSTRNERGTVFGAGSRKPVVTVYGGGK
jgi:hypothetical protein